MATQSGIIVEGPNKPFTVVDNLPRPTPGPKQALVKSLVTGANLMESFQQHTGLLVIEWPAVLGTDGCGVVIEVGDGCTKLKNGDYVFGCCRVGQNQYTPYQATFLVDEDVIFKKSANITLEEASTIGVGLETAALILLAGAGLTLPEPGTKAGEKDEWIVVLGGSGTVGQFAVQLARLCGYKVLASSSKSKTSLVLSQGATATLDSRASVDEQLAEIKNITGGKFARILDASTFGYELMVKALESCSTEPTKYLGSVDDWTPWNSTPASINEYRARLGLLGRSNDPVGSVVTKDLAGWIPSLEGHLEAGTIKPVEYQLISGVGWDKVIEAVQDLESGKAVKKIVVKVQDE